jgi:Protein of unknown function (DUF4054)
MAFTAGVITQQLVGPVTASLISAPASGGTGPYTYQWYRSVSAPPTGPFVPSALNILVGETALTLLDTSLIPNTVYYYILVATDTGNASVTVNSFMLGLLTAQQGQTSYTNPSVADFQNRWFRDFPFDTTYAYNKDTNILTADILNAFQEVNVWLNLRLFITQQSYTQGYLFLAAHYLSQNMVNASQGINGQYNELQTSKGVGPASESFSIPEIFLKNPVFSAWAKTTYGRAYLNCILPNLAGPMSTAFGPTKP